MAHSHIQFIARLFTKIAFFQPLCTSGNIKQEKKNEKSHGDWLNDQWFMQTICYLFSTSTVPVLRVKQWRFAFLQVTLHFSQFSWSKCVLFSNSTDCVCASITSMKWKWAEWWIEMSEQRMKWCSKKKRHLLNVLLFLLFVVIIFPYRNT